MSFISDQFQAAKETALGAWVEKNPWKSAGLAAAAVGIGVAAAAGSPALALRIAINTGVAVVTTVACEEIDKRFSSPTNRFLAKALVMATSISSVWKLGGMVVAEVAPVVEGAAGTAPKTVAALEEPAAAGLGKAKVIAGKAAGAITAKIDQTKQQVGAIAETVSRIGQGGGKEIALAAGKGLMSEVKANQAALVNNVHTATGLAGQTLQYVSYAGQQAETGLTYATTAVIGAMVGDRNAEAKAPPLPSTAKARMAASAQEYTINSGSPM